MTGRPEAHTEALSSEPETSKRGRPMRRIVVAVAGFLAAIGMTLGLTVGAASAAPITCPGGQTATHQNGTWFCQNNGGNPTGAGHHKGTDAKI